MALGYFGASGFYDLNSTAAAANQQSLAQYQNVANVYTSTNTATTLTGVLGGLGSSFGVQYFQAPQGLIDAEEKVVKAAKRAAKGILSKLRSEIDGWHGDVLCREAA